MAQTVSLTTLTETIARAIARFPRERGRIERGAALLALGHVEQIDADEFTVRSQTNDGTTYIVAAGTYSDKAAGCECVDAQRHPGQSCKHAWAVDLLQVAQERQRRQDAVSTAKRFPLLSADEISRLSAWKHKYEAVTQ